MSKAVTLFVAMLALLVGCASTQTSPQPVAFAKPDLSISQEDQWQLMAGKWYGEQPTKDGGTRKWIVERFIDGAYRVDFLNVKNDGVIEKLSEVGQWGVSGPVYFSSFRGWLKDETIKFSDPSNPYNYDAYRIIQLNDKIFEYEHYSSGNRFTVKRVTSDFELK
ncbi:hypothetical protein NO559_02620 [Dasania sp. GY-MA-18]|uniref:Lipoprotein n=1 Tax=Dasania phycosphaerae TaxID=2950436 RepID=A0A9J6RI16_9GAMM|nr:MULTISPECIES: hypothetical protein [Dasania]MCR8921648.1 hypothetical protein [Dasania sp. GY-MA-18]MCZ0864076.1 hypothetical protein [Dasania phycosphaerae]MCZ0867804.1 hypothetical protein [Dasania phycosphaerae]